MSGLAEGCEEGCVVPLHGLVEVREGAAMSYDEDRPLKDEPAWFRAATRFMQAGLIIGVVGGPILFLLTLGPIALGVLAIGLVLVWANRDA